ncbi:Ankyrin repeat-containing domain [Cedratvirus A11]|uniref:Ankyrin repeat-containing domain n=1 Tax=Cedratvirus A11 TaxID=1903266 RepID=A0A1M7XUZ7_9VIRU|nr:Ankyrin repeat-containing domain [Cedratvirus A11]SHO33502.1 Ankyrin repeat-containing domain [Cedratvirus A11]
MEIVYRTIFSFSEGYNFLNRQVCFEFRQLAPKIRGCVYLNQILKDGRGAIFTERRDMVVICIELGLFALLEVCRKYIPVDVCNIAAEKNNLSSLKWCMRQGYKLDGFIYHYIAKNNNLEMAKWVKSDPGIFWSCSAVICSYAAQEGRLEMLQWMRQEGFPWDESTCTGAAYYGHLEVLQWARTNDCPWNESTCTAAAAGGHLEVLKWARSWGCPWDANTYHNAVRAGYPEIIKWLVDNGCPQE